MIAYDSLREFITLAESIGETRTIRGASWDLELACINQLVAEQRGPLLIFDDIPGCQPGFRVATNGITNLARTRLALGMDQGLGPVEVLDRWRHMLKTLETVAPVEVEQAPVMQNVLTQGRVDLTAFPIPRWHPADGGRYLNTGGIVIMRDPDEGWINCAVNRGMLVGPQELGLQIGAGSQNSTIVLKYRERRETCPVAIAVSPDPILMIAGGFKVPWGQSEYEFAGGLRQRPVALTNGVYTGLPVPAAAEIVIEGEIEPGASCDEGPFGEWTGYITGSYKKEGGFPHLVRVKSIMYMDDPIMLGVRPLKPPANWYTAVPITNAAGIWNELEACGHRGIRAVWTHVLESFGAIWIVVAIDQLYKGHSKEIGIAAAVCPSADGWGAFTIIVDDDVDVTNLEEIMWTLAMRCRLDRDVHFLNGIRTSSLLPWVTAEERRQGRVTGARLVFDACKDFDRKDDFPPVSDFEQSYRTKIAAKWGLTSA